ncbi:50S ribosomal protein L31e [Candidatus Woesearchaeota archaeon]|nr:50S ribosomal protein L31e [Candidatus Woesearchaeota archaeon]
MSNELKRTYNIPLRKEYLKVAYYKRSKKAVTALKQFVKKHMKIDNMENVLIGKYLNEEIWKRGISNPPHHVHVNILKDIKENKALVELFDKPIGFDKKKESKKEEKSSGAKERIKEKLGLKEDKNSGSKEAGIEGKVEAAKSKKKKETIEEKKKETSEEKAEKAMEHVKEIEHEKQEKAEEIEKEEIKEMKKELPKTHHHIPKSEEKEKRIEPHQQGPMHL